MDAKEFGAFIQLRRKELGMTQTELAEKLKVTAKAVSRWERGVGSPDLSLIAPLCDALGMTADELLAGSDAIDEAVKELGNDNTLGEPVVNKLLSLFISLHRFGFME